MWLYFVLVVAAYLLGSIPSAVWIGRRFYGIDVREHGSHNAGATNTLRVLGRRAALPVFLLDVLKGMAAVALAWFALARFGYPDGQDPRMNNLEFTLVAAVVLGHMFPIFARFRGGKGVATLAGAMLAMQPHAVLICLGVFTIILLTTHYVSLGSITAGVCFPFAMLVDGVRYPPMLAFAGLVSILLIISHLKNIRRLIAGTESKIYVFRRKG